MSTLRADGVAIEARIAELKLEDPKLTYQEISNRTSDLKPPFIEVSERTLARARSGEVVQATALTTIAEVLGVDLSGIVATADQLRVEETMQSTPTSVKTMTAIAAAGAPAVNAEESATVSISINSPPPPAKG